MTKIKWRPRNETFKRRRNFKMKLSKVYKAKTYEEAEKLCPRGYRIPKIWELVKLAEEKNKKIFETEKESNIFFWSSSLDGNGLHRLSRGRYCYWYAIWYYLYSSNKDGRVVYVKEDLKK